MNELTTQSRQLPDTLEDLARFVLIGREKLTAVRAEIRAIKKVELAKEVHEQKLEEGQEIAEAVLDAEVKIGELTSKMKKAQGFASSISDNGVPNATKQKQLEKIGITEKRKQRYEALAAHPDTVEKAKADARAEGRIVTRQDVLNRIITPQKKNPLKEVSKEAWRNHMKVEISPIVDLEDVKKDQENKNLIQAETKVRVLKMIETCTTISIIPDKDITGMWRKMDDRQKETLQRQLLNASKAISHILALSEE